MLRIVRARSIQVYTVIRHETFLPFQDNRPHHLSDQKCFQLSKNEIFHCKIWVSSTLNIFWPDRWCGPIFSKSIQLPITEMKAKIWFALSLYYVASEDAVFHFNESLLKTIFKNYRLKSAWIQWFLLIMQKKIIMIQTKQLMLMIFRFNQNKPSWV